MQRKRTETSVKVLVLNMASVAAQALEHYNNDIAPRNAGAVRVFGWRLEGNYETWRRSMEVANGPGVPADDLNKGDFVWAGEGLYRIESGLEHGKMGATLWTCGERAKSYQRKGGVEMLPVCEIDRKVQVRRQGKGVVPLA